MTCVRISLPTKSAMQSVSRAQKWIIEFPEGAGTRFVDTTMGWTSSTDMGTEVKLEFTSCIEAIKFATNNNWSYEVIEPKERKLIKKNYADNFK